MLFGSRNGDRAASMHDAPPHSAKLIAFLLAHQLDEILLAPIIRDAKNEGRRVAIVYLTAARPRTGVARTGQGSSNLLAELGVDVDKEVIFLGERLSITTGLLYRNLGEIHAALVEAIKDIAPVEHIYVHAWEGGCLDHDAAHVIALGVARDLGLTHAVLQVPFLRASRTGPISVALFSPLRENGPVAYYRLTLKERQWWLRLYLRYPRGTCFRAWHWPLLLIAVMAKPGIPIQFASLDRLTQRPMPGLLRYEQLGRSHFKVVDALIASYWSAIGGCAIETER